VYVGIHLHPQCKYTSRVSGHVLRVLEGQSTLFKFSRLSEGSMLAFTLGTTEQSTVSAHSHNHGHGRGVHQDRR